MSSERKYYQLPLDPSEDKDIVQHLDSLTRNTRPDFVKSAIREKMNEKRDKELSETIEKILVEKIPEIIKSTFEELSIQKIDSADTSNAEPKKVSKKPKRPVI